MSVKKGSFEIDNPQNFAGVGKEFPSNSSIRSFTFYGAYVPDDDLKMSEVWNVKRCAHEDAGECIGYETVPRSKVDFVFDLSRFPLGFSYTHLYKEQIRVSGFSLGLTPSPYVRFIFGMNQNHWETGFYGSLGLEYNEASYELQACYHDWDENGIFSVTCRNSEAKNKKISNILYGFGGYASFNLKPFAISYSPAISHPWSSRELPVGGSRSFLDQVNVTIEYPLLLTQYVGLSFWIGEHWKLSAGSNLMSGIYFNDMLWSVIGSIGFWF